jgi:5'-nucleotidase
MKRRAFIKKSIITSTTISQFPHFWIKNIAAQEHQIKITLLQTNDTHSRIDPFPMDGGRNQGMGGIARRATVIEQIRRENPYTLLLDAGDVLQGTPYFNLFKGKLEYLTMSKCSYDATTLGNHEFDNGVESLVDALSYAKFDIVNCNYNFSDSPLSHKVKTYITRQVGPIKIGITGIGINFTDLVLPKNHQGITYEDPFKPLQSVVNYLRKDGDCNLIVVLSHLGYKPYDNRPGDTDIAQRVKGIDWIVSGHSHTFMHEPDEYISREGKVTRILQVGFAGILLGKTDFIFQGKDLLAVKTENISVNPTIPNLFATDNVLS